MNENDSLSQPGETLRPLGKLKLALGSGAMLAIMGIGLGIGIKGIAADKEPAESPLVGSSMMHYNPTETDITKDSDVCAAADSIVRDANAATQIDIVGCATESKKLTGLPQGTRVRVEVHRDGSVTAKPLGN
ncbi:hypothetical protein FBF27_03005 [Candidatus Saccharibacteria bacterium oral taxon 488]|nr:hypothetical protein FBF27_03005 [Candidatus Saccharibacteria bacterium oral taxon 488]